MRTPEHHNPPINIAFANRILGKTVSVTVDRPLGSQHPNHPDIVYPINYGYIPGIPAPDGEEQDAYLLGIDTPIRSYTGQVIGVIQRMNDIENKLVVAPHGRIFYQNEIIEMVHFQEQYFKTQIESLYRKSAGMIIYQRAGDGIRYLVLFQRQSRTWSIPKGHMEAFETEKEAAIREVREETGLLLSPLPRFREEISYTITANKRKKVVFFLSEFCPEKNKSNRLSILPDEILNYRFVPKAKAQLLLKHQGYFDVLEKAERAIHSR